MRLWLQFHNKWVVQDSMEVFTLCNCYNLISSYTTYRQTQNAVAKRTVWMDLKRYQCELREISITVGTCRSDLVAPTPLAPSCPFLLQLLYTIGDISLNRVMMIKYLAFNQSSFEPSIVWWMTHSSPFLTLIKYQQRLSKILKNVQRIVVEEYCDTLQGNRTRIYKSY